MTLWFDVVNSQALSGEQKELIMRRLATRIGKDGVLRFTSQQTRSQAANRELVVERFADSLCEALKQPPARKRTRVSRAAKQRRLEVKKQRGLLKGGRSRKIPIEE